MTSAKRIVILGSTGSIGQQTLDMVRAHPDRLTVVGLAAGSDVEGLASQCQEFGVVESVLAARDGPDSLCDLIGRTQPDLLVAAISGLAGLTPVLVALQAGVDVALANKEPLVAAGELVVSTATRAGALLLPIDSEISAVFQCLHGQDRAALEKVLLTASGGPFARLSAKELAKVTPRQALDHPTWKMGPKVTIDSATLANKGFEVFELKHLFRLSFDQIEVVIHHQSIIHSMVQFQDGSIIAQMGLPDMRIPIQYALMYPERVANDLPRLDLDQVGQLTFASPDVGKFPCLRLAFEAGRSGKSYPVVLNAADEEAVRLFLEEPICFMDIPRLIERALEAHQPQRTDSLDDVLEADRWAREFVHQLCSSQ